jgi:hypothetical protein
MDMVKKRSKQRAANFWWMLFTLLASVGVIEFHTTEAYSSLDITRAKYNRHWGTGDEQEKIMLQTRPHNLIQCENI